ncbi:Sesquiterpene synthase [Vitis vinifera]|uniref:Sesquiterpene synthase n=1 Tax=Vitis vinifera TaxID=29760 RepID=A0A438FNM6_VITVI|nr:Sesquiterpene synthase [Vitis vinifera]
MCGLGKERKTYDKFNKQIANPWKDITQGFLRPTSMSVPILTGVLNLTRVVDINYKENDEYTRVRKVMKDNIASLFIDPVSV